jgi:putative ferrous iron transport protein C
MILSDLRQYLQERGQATLADLALHFETDPAAVRPMLDLWIRKGKVQRWEAGTGCGTSCQRCDAAATEIYCWSEDPADPPVLGGISCPPDARLPSHRK